MKVCALKPPNARLAQLTGRCAWAAARGQCIRCEHDGAHGVRIAASIVNYFCSALHIDSRPPSLICALQGADLMFSMQSTSGLGPETGRNHAISRAQCTGKKMTCILKKAFTHQQQLPAPTKVVFNGTT